MSDKSIDQTTAIIDLALKTYHLQTIAAPGERHEEWGVPANTTHSNAQMVGDLIAVIYDLQVALLAASGTEAQASAVRQLAGFYTAEFNGHLAYALPGPSDRCPEGANCAQWMIALLYEAIIEKDGDAMPVAAYLTGDTIQRAATRALGVCKIKNVPYSAKAAEMFG